VAVGFTLDAGALIAAEKNSRQFWALWKSAIAQEATVTIPAPVLAQVFRSYNIQVSRVMKGCEIEALDEERAKRVGARLGLRKTADVVDATVVTGALSRGDAIVTSDRGDIERLLDPSERKRLKIVDV
jgi:predicted nucleic acid-binding protein